LPDANASSDREVPLGAPAPSRTADTRELAELRELLLGGERRQLDDMRDRLGAIERTVERLDRQSTAALARLDANAAVTAHAVPTLAGFVERIVASTRRWATGGLSRFTWLVPVVLLIGLGATLLVRSNQRWSRAVAALERQPGIVLVRADRGLGGWRFTGLRDPLAVSPAALLAGVGADTASIDARWEPYVSTQPQMVLARARRILAPPSTVALTLTGDTLIARGRATRTWRERTTTFATTLPGVAYADLSGVADAVPAELDSLRRLVTEHRVMFSAGSDSLGSAGRAAADSISAQLIRLHAAAVREGYGIAVVLVGRTDTLGLETTQLALGSRRAEVVREALIASGVPSTEIEVRSLGSTDPLPADDPDSSARINRSVSVEVTVSDDASLATLREPGRGQ
jgi:OOP family OmpA-OmpF porin